MIILWAVMATLVWKMGLHLIIQLVPITTKYFLVRTIGNWLVKSLCTPNFIYY